MRVLALSLVKLLVTVYCDVVSAVVNLSFAFRGIMASWEVAVHSRCSSVIAVMTMHGIAGERYDALRIRLCYIGHID